MRTNLRPLCKFLFGYVCSLFLVPALFQNVADAAQKHSTPLALEDRVAFQRSIEQVYWNHRIWPKENKTLKPQLDAVLPEASLRAKVEDYLRSPTRWKPTGRDQFSRNNSRPK